MQLDCKDESVEAIIDKGSLDALMCTGSTLEKVEACMREFFRVLVPGGMYFVVTGQSRTSSFLGSQQGAKWKIKEMQIDVELRRPLHVIIMHKK